MKSFLYFWCVKNVCAHFNQRCSLREAFNPETLLMDVKMLPLERFHGSANALYRKSVIDAFLK